jgi:ferric-dicitrate binding protein FerR (iron transport regulator)
MTRIHERRRIFALLDDRLSPGGRLALERHLEECAACREYLEKVREARESLASMGGEEPEMNWLPVDDAVERAATAPKEVPGQVRWPRWALGTALAAATAALVLVVAHRQLGAPDEEGVHAPVNPEVEVKMTLLDSLPRPARLTLVGKDTRWRRPGLGWQGADLETVITEHTGIETGDGAVASVQVAPLSGVRLEPSTRASFEQITREIVRVDLEQGTVSLRVHSRSGLRDVRVHTPEAVVRVSGTTLSVDERSGRTRVVVAKGRATVEPASGGDAHVLEAPAILDIDAAGIQRPEDGTQAEVQRLRNIHFNFFESVPDAAVAFSPQDETHRATITVGEKLAGMTPLAMLAPADASEATLTFEDGSTLITPLKVEPLATTVVKFTAPEIETEPARTKRLASKAARETSPAEQEAEEPEEPEHAGFLAPALVKMVLKKQHGRLRDCYQKYLDRDPSAGVVKARIRFTVGLAGKVAQASASTNGDAKLEACLAGATKSITFPPPSGGTIEFEYPVTFAPK